MRKLAPAACAANAAPGAAAALGIALCAALGATPAVAGDDNSIGLFAGKVSSHKVDGGSRDNTHLNTALGAELTHYLRMDRAVLIGYRQSTDGPSQRNDTQETYLGGRYLLFGVGPRYDDSVANTNVKFDSTFKLGVDATVGIGRATIEFQSVGGVEYGNETLGFGLGLFSSIQVASFLAIELRVAAEDFQPRGGTASAIAVSGENVFALGGATFTF